MNELLDLFASHRTRSTRKSAAPFPSGPNSEAHRHVLSRPRYHCDEQSDALILVVHVPGADPTGVDLEVNAPDLTITATRGHSNGSVQLAEVVRDYQLRLRLGFGLAYDALKAELRGGTLKVTIPKKAA